MNILLKKKKVGFKIANIYLFFWVKILWNSFQNAQEDGNQSNLFAMSKLFVKSTIIICHFHLSTSTEAHFVRSKGNVNGSYMSCPLLRKLKEFSFNEEAMYIYCLLISPKDSINTFTTCRKLLCYAVNQELLYTSLFIVLQCVQDHFIRKYILKLYI